MTLEPYELFALRYGHHGGRKQVDNVLGGDSHNQGSDLDYFVWVARGSNRIFLIDTGFSAEQAERRGRELVRPVPEALKALSINPGAIEDVILTHMHYDHAGNLDDYSSARFHVQDSEISFCTGRCMCQPHLQSAFEIEDVVSLVRRVYSGHVEFHDGDSEIASGLSVHRIGGHTAGLQAVRVWTRRGWVVLASDASHLYANFRHRQPFPIVVNVAEMLEGYRTILSLADSPDHVIPGHDPLVMSLYPPVSDELAGIAVRLDVAPRTTAC